MHLEMPMAKYKTEKEDIQSRWKECFESVLTANPDDTDSMIFFTAENEDTAELQGSVVNFL